MDDLQCYIFYVIKDIMRDYADDYIKVRDMVNDLPHEDVARSIWNTFLSCLKESVDGKIQCDVDKGRIKI